MSCAKEEYHSIAMATGGHNQQTVRITVTVMNFNVKLYLLPHCLGYHDNQNVNLPQDFVTEYQLGCIGWSFMLELELKMVENVDTNQQIGLFTCNRFSSMAWLYITYC